jgi:uncharacterized membrane protein
MPGIGRFVIVFTAAASPALAQPSIRALGGLPGGDQTSVAIAVSADGSTVTGRSTVGGQIRAFRWTLEDGMIPTGGFPAQHRSVGQAVSADGSIVAFTNTQMDSPRQDTTACLWTAAGYENLGFFPGGHTTHPIAMTSDGQTLVGKGATPSGGSRAIRWNRLQGWTELGTLGGLFGASVANGISDNAGVIVGKSRSPNTSWSEAFVWTPQVRHGGDRFPRLPRGQ